MKTVITTILLGVFGLQCRAQGVGGIFTQQLNKDKIMMEQIALQATYLSEIKKGYQTTQNGLNTAHDLKNGSFTLNQGYFNSLSQVSPAVRNNPKIKLVATYQQQIISCFDHEIAWQKQQAILGADEISYLQAVYNNLLSQCAEDMDELVSVTTSGQVQMTDAERIRHIDGIYTATNDKYRFSASFTQNARAFALDRQSGKQQALIIGKLYNLN